MDASHFEKLELESGPRSGGPSRNRTPPSRLPSKAEAFSSSDV